MSTITQFSVEMQCYQSYCTIYFPPHRIVLRYSLIHDNPFVSLKFALRTVAGYAAMFFFLFCFFVVVVVFLE